jgi:CheY-like chemotaxis protein
MSRKPTILCVDDRADSLLIRKMMLEQFGCAVVTVTDSRACVNALDANSIDLVLIDYHLAEATNGEDLARRIRASRPGLPLIMLTGDPKIPESVHESVDAVLIKGASNPADMLDLIQELLPEASLKSRPPQTVPGTISKAS